MLLKPQSWCSVSDRQSLGDHRRCIDLCGSTASFIHLAERDAQPYKFGTIPDTMWWSIVTLGTIGYGDGVPVAPLGKLVAAVTIICGIVTIALPVGHRHRVSDQIHRRDFVVTWGMVARVPLFDGLDATAITQIMRLLRAQIADSGDIIVRRGDTAHSMYSSPMARSSSSSRATASPSASASSSARSRCCAGRAAPPPCGRRRGPTSWCSMRRTFTS
jgi:hypothetical protein